MKKSGVYAWGAVTKHRGYIVFKLFYIKVIGITFPVINPASAIFFSNCFVRLNNKRCYHKTFQEGPTPQAAFVIFQLLMIYFIFMCTRIILVQELQIFKHNFPSDLSSMVS